MNRFISPMVPILACAAILSASAVAQPSNHPVTSADHAYQANARNFRNALRALLATEANPVPVGDLVDAAVLADVRFVFEATQQPKLEARIVQGERQVVMSYGWISHTRDLLAAQALPRPAGSPECLDKIRSDLQAESAMLDDARAVGGPSKGKQTISGLAERGPACREVLEAARGERHARTLERPLDVAVQWGIAQALAKHLTHRVDRTQYSIELDACDDLAADRLAVAWLLRMRVDVLPAAAGPWLQATSGGAGAAGANRCCPVGAKRYQSLYESLARSINSAEGAYAACVGYQPGSATRTAAAKLACVGASCDPERVASTGANRPLAAAPMTSPQSSTCGRAITAILELPSAIQTCERKLRWDRAELDAQRK